MLFKKDELQELEDLDKFEVVLEEIIDTTRWSVVEKRIFKYEGKYYRTTYSYGATECQDEAPYDDEPDMIECPEVFPKEVITTVYVTEDKL